MAYRDAVSVLDEHLHGLALVRRQLLVILILGVYIVEIKQQHNLVLNGLVQIMLQRV